MNLQEKIQLNQQVGLGISGSEPTSLQSLVNAALEVNLMQGAAYTGPVDADSPNQPVSPAAMAARDKIRARDAGEPEAEGDLIVPDLKAALQAVAAKANELANQLP